MAKKKFLEILIDSLDKGELKRFALYSNTYASNKSYIRLFKQLKNNKAPQIKKYDNKYAQQRRYLYRTILESLIYRVADNNPEAEVLFLIKSATFLLFKQLPDQAYDVINKALQLVRKYEMFGYQIQLIEIEKQVRLHMHTKDYRNDNEIVEEEKDLIAYQSELQKMRLIFNHIMAYKKKYGYVNPLLAKQLDAELVEMKMPEKASGCLSNKSRYYYYYSKTIVKRMSNKTFETYDYSDKLMRMDTKPLTKFEQINALLEHTTSCICLGKTDELLDILDLVQQNFDNKAYGNFDNLALRLFYYKSNYELMSYVFEGNREKVINKIVEIEQGIARWGDRIPIEMQMILSSALRLGYFAINELRKARREAMFMEKHLEMDIRMDVYEDGMISNLIYLFLKNDTDYLEIYARKLDKYFKSKDGMDDMDMQFKFTTTKLFLDYAIYKIDKSSLLLSFKKALEVKMAHYDNKFSEIDYPYYIWVNATINKQDYLDQAREMAKLWLNR